MIQEAALVSRGVAFHSEDLAAVDGVDALVRPSFELISTTNAVADDPSNSK